MHAALNELEKNPELDNALIAEIEEYMSNVQPHENEHTMLHLHTHGSEDRAPARPPS